VRDATNTKRPRRRVALSLACALVALAVAVPLPARAYVRSRTNGGLDVPTAWGKSCIPLRIYIDNPPLELGGADYLAAAQNAAVAWSHSSLDCTVLNLTVTSAPEDTADVGLDGENRVVFRKDDWCLHPPPTDPNEAPCHDSAALAVTSVFQNKKTGEIVDADVEVNAYDFTWGDLIGQPALFAKTGDCKGSTACQIHDFQNALTHEFGHVIGLAHTCYQAGVETQQPDNNGNPAPACSSPDLSPVVTEATMYVSVAPGDIARRSLSPDDQQAACDIYPFTGAACTTSSASVGTSSGCAVAPGRPTRAGLVGGVPLLFVIGLLLRTRRRS
jgi:hypothetical protein